MLHRPAVPLSLQMDRLPAMARIRSRIDLRILAAVTLCRHNDANSFRGCFPHRCRTKRFYTFTSAFLEPGGLYRADVISTLSLALASVEFKQMDRRGYGIYCAPAGANDGRTRMGHLSLY